MFDRVRVRRESERGTVLVMALGFTLVVGTLLAASVTVTTLQAKSSRSSSDSLLASGVAEGATELAQKAMLEALADFEDPPMAGTETIGGISADWTAEQIGPTTTRVDVDGAVMVGTPVEIACDLTVGDGSTRVRKVVDLTETPLFQYMIYYDSDLEILPGASMILEGRVHANGDIHLGTHATLTIDADYFRSTGRILRERKDDGTTTGGTVSIKKYDSSTFVSMQPDEDSDGADWIQDALATWDGTVQSGDHGVREVLTPAMRTMEPGGYYQQEADLVIRDGVAYAKNGNPIPLPAGVLTQKTMYDAREGTDVTVTEIDLDALGATGRFPRNGLLYAYRTDASVAKPNGFRLINGEELRDDLTVVSVNSVYVQGDYNTKSKKSAAVIADAVHLLSNSWNDSKRAGTLPSASDTTFQLAMITGDVPTPDGGGSYSGGFENLPRFHENWSGRTATIRGAFARLYESAFARSPWTYGADVYTAPNRDWRYDSDFLDPDALPPFTPNAVYVRRLLWDDDREIVFKVDDASIASMPNQPVFDPWDYDPTFLVKIIDDPNAISHSEGYRRAAGTVGQAADGFVTSNRDGLVGTLTNTVDGTTRTVNNILAPLFP